jgi:hypothetical protein
MLKIVKLKCHNLLQEVFQKTIKLGISSTSKTGRVNQRRENGIEIGASRSIPISISFPDLERVDTLTTSQEEISSSRPKMVDQARNGTSISLQELSEADQSTNLLISTTQVNPTTCNTTALVPTGGRCSSILV